MTAGAYFVCRYRAKRILLPLWKYPARSSEQDTNANAVRKLAAFDIHAVNDKGDFFIMVFKL